jgi:hypothetical protein
MSAVFTFLSVKSYGSSLDLDYVKKVDLKLYQRLVEIKKCQDTQKSASECVKKTTPDNISKISDEAENPISKNNEKLKSEQTQWWLTSSYYKAPDVKQWLNAVQSTFSIDKLYGNIEGSQYSADLKYYSRYGQWTHLFSLGYAKDYVKQSGLVALDRKYHLFNYNARYDLNESWFAQLGYLEEKDTSLALEDAAVHFAGVGSYIYNTDKFILTSFAALGDKTERFSLGNSELTGLDKFNYKVAYGFQRLKWNLSKELAFIQSFEVYHSLDALADFELAEDVNLECIETLTSSATYCIVEYENRNKIILSLGLEYKLNQYLSLSYSLDFTKDSQPFLTDSSNNASHSLSIIANFQ